MINLLKKINNDHRGISLMELVVVVAVFSLVMVIAMDLYFAAHKSERKIVAIQKVQSDARYSMEAIAREVRVEKIDYSYYSDGQLTAQPFVDVLALRDEDNKPVIFKKMVDTIAGCTATLPCLGVKIGDDGDWQRMTPKNIAVDKLDFYISPTADPFDASATIKEQPRVTIVFGSHNIAPNSSPEDQKNLILQTTASSRNYSQ